MRHFYRTSDRGWYGSGRRHARFGPTSIGYAGGVIAFFSSRLGCLGSLLASLVLTALLIAILSLL